MKWETKSFRSQRFGWLRTKQGGREEMGCLWAAYGPLWRLINVMADQKVSGRDKRISDRRGGKKEAGGCGGWEQIRDRLSCTRVRPAGEAMEWLRWETFMIACTTPLHLYDNNLLRYLLLIENIFSIHWPNASPKNMVPCFSYYLHRVWRAVTISCVFFTRNILSTFV